jgi:nitrate reductase gamma subunit
MDEIINKKESIDKDLGRLEIHSPSMRFTKTLVESVKAETNLIVKEKAILPWIPKLCITGFLLMSISLVVIFLTSGTSIDATKRTQIAQLFSYVFMSTLGLILFFGLDSFLKRNLAKQ